MKKNLINKGGNGLDNKWKGTLRANEKGSNSSFNIMSGSCVLSPLTKLPNVVLHTTNTLSATNQARKTQQSKEMNFDKGFSSAIFKM